MYRLDIQYYKDRLSKYYHNVTENIFIVTIHIIHFVDGRIYVMLYANILHSFPVAQLVEHGACNAKIMGLIPRESKN